MKVLIFKAFSVGLATLAGYALIDRLPDIEPSEPRQAGVDYRPIELPRSASAFAPAGAWIAQIDDRRWQGLSGLEIDGNRLVAVSDLGAGVTFDLPAQPHPVAELADLTDGPRDFGSKKNRDAEAVRGDGRGGWLVAFENHHSLWRFDRAFRHGRLITAFHKPEWRANIGIEALARSGSAVLALAQTGREVLVGDKGQWRTVAVDFGWQVADAAGAPDGSTWLLLRSVSVGGFDEAIAPLIAAGPGYRIGPIERFPKRAFDNFEGMAIAAIPGGWRFWLVSDDGHYLWPHTVLMALDLPRTQENARR